jgi:hypothetical protein
VIHLTAHVGRLGITKRLAVVFIACVLSVACTPDVSHPEASTLAREVGLLLERRPAVGPLPRELWPSSVAKLKPQAVYVRAEGLYITTWSFFAQERGVFVLNPKAALTPVRGTDPHYEPVGQGVFVYRIAG